jgi:hypothetical protein
VKNPWFHSSTTIRFTDYVIYSPDVPVFVRTWRSSGGTVSMITSSAVYAKRIQMERQSEILPAMWSSSQGLSVGGCIAMTA